MKHRYLINNKIYSSSTEMPKISDPLQTPDSLDNYIKVWQQSLTELACDEITEIQRWISNNIIHANVYDCYDITSITTVRDDKVCFKEVESESNEAIDFLSWVLNSGFHLNPHCKENKWRTIEQINSSKSMLLDGITTKQLYEIFKK